MRGSSGTRRPRWGCWATLTALRLGAPATSILSAKSRRSTSTSWASPTTWRTLRRLRPCRAQWSGPPPSRDPPAPNVAATNQVMKRTRRRRRMCLVLLFCKCFFFFFFDGSVPSETFSCTNAWYITVFLFFLLLGRRIVTQGVTSSLTMAMKAQMKCRRFEYLHFIIYLFNWFSVTSAPNWRRFLSQVEPCKTPVIDTTESTDSEQPPLIAHYLYIQVSFTTMLLSYH